MPKIVMVTLA